MPQVVLDNVFGYYAAVDSGRRVLLVFDQGLVVHERYYGQSLWAKHFDAENGWGPPEPIYDHGEPVPNGLGPQLAFLPSGHALLTWTIDGLVWVAQFNAAGGWSVPTRLARARDEYSGATIAINAAESGFLIFKEDGCFSPCPPGPVTYSTYVSRWSPRNGFASPELVIRSRLAGSTDPARIATDAAGNAFAARSASAYPDYPRQAVAIARFEPQRGWLPPVVIPAFNQGGQVAPGIFLLDLAADPAGDAVALWSAEEVARGATLWAASFHQSTGWDSPRRVDSSNLSVGNEGAAAWTPNGEVTALWYQGLTPELWTSQMDSSGAWGAPQQLSKTAVPLCHPAVAPDGSGGLVAAWLATIANANSIWAAQFTPGHGWGEPAPLASARSVSCPFLAAAASGPPFLFWSQTNEQASPSGQRYQLYMRSVETQ